MATMKIIYKNPADSCYDEKYKDELAIEAVVSYVLNPDKTQGYIGGWGVSPTNAVREMELLQRLYHKDSGVRIRHWIIGFTPSEIERAASNVGEAMDQLLWTMGALLAEYYNGNYQVVWGVHLDKPREPHIHFAMSTVSLVNGKKYSGSKTDYSAYIAYAKSVLRYYGINLWPISDQAASKYVHTY